MTTGTVTKYDPDGATGYISPDEDDDKIPFDRKSLVDFEEGDYPRPGDRVTFTVEGGMAGLWAVGVRRIE